MRSKSTIVAYLTIFIFSSNQVFAQSSEEIIKKTLEVHLGKESWKNIKSVRKEGISFSLKEKDTAEIIDIITAKGQSYSEYKRKSRKTIIGCDGERIWYDIFPKDSPTKLYKLEDKRFENKNMSVFPTDAHISILFNALKVNNVFLEENKEQINQEKCFVLKVEQAKDIFFYFYINSQNYQIRAVKNIKNDELVFVERYEEYKKIKGVLFVVRTYNETNFSSFYTIINDIQINPELSEDIFEKPKK